MSLSSLVDEGLFGIWRLFGGPAGPDWNDGMKAVRISRATRVALMSAALTALGASARAQLGRVLSCETKTTVTRDNSTVTRTDRIWVQTPHRMRDEAVGSGQKQTTIVNGTDMWVYLPASKQAVHKRLSAKELAAVAERTRATADMVGWFLKLGGKKAGREKVGGVLCDRYQRTDKQGMTYRLWVQTGPGHLPRRSEESGILRGAVAFGQPEGTHIVRTVTDYTSWQTGRPADSSLFRLPAGVTVREMK